MLGKCVYRFSSMVKRKEEEEEETDRKNSFAILLKHQQLCSLNFFEENKQWYDDLFQKVRITFV